MFMSYASNLYIFENLVIQLQLPKNCRRKMKYCKQLFAEYMEWTLTTFCYILALFQSCGQTAGGQSR